MGFFYFYTLIIKYKMNIKNFLDSTYLKTASQANLSENENTEIVVNCIQEAIDNDFKLIMIRPDKVALAKKMIQLSGLELGKDIEIRVTGLRPGEKLYEELLAQEENTIPTHHPQILTAKVRTEADEQIVAVNDYLCRPHRAAALTIRLRKTVVYALALFI